MAKRLQLSFLDLLYVIGALALVILIAFGNIMGNTLLDVFNWYITIISLISIYLAVQKKNTVLTVLWIVVLILFIPLLNISFITKPIMAWIRGLTALLMLILAFVKK